jgi:circadian clock protein KaiB
MKKKAAISAEARAMEAAIAAHAAAVYVLRLYVTGSSPRSARAISNICKICEEHLEGRYDLEVLDISQNPALAKSEQILAAPTLIKTFPLPTRRFVGDMSQSERIVLGLGCRKAAKRSAAKTVCPACP